MVSDELIMRAERYATANDEAVILYSGPISEEGFSQLLQVVSETWRSEPRQKVCLILATYGGDANAAYKIARLLQGLTNGFSLYLPMHCKSAGTLIALGASTLYMTPISELGPLDVQLYQRDEIGQRRSGLLFRTAFDSLCTETFDVFQRTLLDIKRSSGGSISFETASRLSAQIAAQVMTPIYAQVSPEALGADMRDLNIATQYGLRLVQQGGNASEDTVMHLVHNYPSHDFVIDSSEAKSLFREVRSPDDNLRQIVMELGTLMFVSKDEPLVLRLDTAGGNAEDEEETSDAEAEHEGTTGGEGIDSADEGDADDSGYADGSGDVARRDDPPVEGDPRSATGGAGT